jgi:hypothetical protein
VKASKEERRWTRIDEVCRTKPTAVREEVCKILGVEQGDLSAQNYFEKRTAAAKRIYDNMNEAEKKVIDDGVIKQKEAPNEPEIQRK